MKSPAPVKKIEVLVGDVAKHFVKYGYIIE
jgi:hypothetical protein